MARQDSLVMGVRKQPPADINDYGVQVRYPDRMMDSPPPETGGLVAQQGLVSDWLEMWDYVGGNRFRGFVADKSGDKSMFVFFDQSLIGSDLKAGYVFLLLMVEAC
jgi:hypothetical protein